MKRYPEIGTRELRRRRRERILMVVLFVVISFLTYFGTRLFDLGVDLPISNSILIFALININVILLLLLLFLTMRNLVKLLFEKRRNIMGARLRIKLVLAFVSLSLLPTIILFFVSVQFISSSIDFWFDMQIEQSLKNSLEVGQDYYKEVADEVLSFGNKLARVMTYEGYMLIARKDRLEKLINDKRKEYNLASMKIFSQKLELRADAQDPNLDLSPFKGPGMDALKKALDQGADAQSIQSSRHGDLVSGIVPVFSRTETKAVVGLIVVSKFIPRKFVNRLKAISKGLQGYRQLKMLKKPMKISHMIMLSTATLLIIFLSVWFGFYLSKEITTPIKELAEGTNRIAAGDYDIYIDFEAKDEIGVLVDSFNRMTMDLKTSKNKLEEANLELVKSNVELEQRRLYMETVLASVAGGVISTNADGKILTMNRSAEKMLAVKAEEVIGNHFRDVLPEDYIRVIDKFLNDSTLFRKGFLKEQINISIEDKRLTILASVNVLRDDRGNYVGLVVVLEDLSDIEKAQRMAAWREVARRIAHEVKNPLTPIQLSAQRLEKKFEAKLNSDDAEIFHECTGMIIKQVEELKGLVNEFSNFARMPSSNPVPADVKEIIREAMSLYKEAHKDIQFTMGDEEEIPIFNLDPEQMKRVMINLFDNAIEAMNGNGEVHVALNYDKLFQTVRIEVADNGKGISPEHKARLFEPYFSTKRHGTGLGLVIVSTIVTDHNGFVRVQDNQPKGTKFIIELPVRT